jgi:hypothetical protein
MIRKWTGIALAIALLGTAQQGFALPSKNLTIQTKVYGIQHNQNPTTAGGCQLVLGEGVTCWGTGGIAGIKQGLENALQIAGSRTTSCALIETREVACWGSNTTGQLGQGTTDATNRSNPIVVPGLSDVDSIFAAARGSDTAFCAVKTSSETVCWGSHPYTATPRVIIAANRNATEVFLSIDALPSAEICFRNKSDNLFCRNGASWLNPIQGEVSNITLSRNRICGVVDLGNVMCGNTRTANSAETVYQKRDAIDVAITTTLTCVLTDSAEVHCTETGAQTVEEKIKSSPSIDSHAKFIELHSHGTLIYAYMSDGQQLLLTDSVEDGGKNFTPYLPANLAMGFTVESLPNRLNLSWKGNLSLGVVVDYHVEIKDRSSTNWRVISDGISSQKTATIDNLKSGTLYDVRVSPVLSSESPDVTAGRYELSASTPGLAPNTFVLLDEFGFPVIDAALNWETLDGKFRSSKPSVTNDEGAASFPRIPAKKIRIAIDGGKMLGGEKISGHLIASAGAGRQTFHLPNPPSKLNLEVNVTLPDGHPVPDAQVEFGGLDGYTKVSNEHFIGGVLSSSDFNVSTDHAGFARASGWHDPTASAPLTAQATFDDGTLFQMTDWEPINGNSATLELEYMPVMETANLTINTLKNKLVPIDFQIVNPINDQPASNTRVTIVPPKGAKQSGCKGRPKLSTVSSQSGIASLKVCASAAGVYKVNSIGAVTVGMLQINLKNSAPLTPSDVKVIYSNDESAISWGDTNSSSEAPTTAIRITARAFGTPKVFRATVSPGSPEFANRVVILAGLEGKRVSVIQIQAVSKNGTSPNQTSFMVVRNFE